MTMSTLARTRNTPFAELLEWLDTAQPFHLKGDGWIAVEEYAEDDRYVVRADLPGIDPDQDVEVSLDGDLLTIHGERREESRQKQRSEVRYGSFTRTFRLPRGCAPDEVTASYEAGVLEVSIPVRESETEAVRIPVARNEK
jgi:HSP20 family protein